MRISKSIQRTAAATGVVVAVALSGGSAAESSGEPAPVSSRPMTQEYYDQPTAQIVRAARQAAEVIGCMVRDEKSGMEPWPYQPNSLQNYFYVTGKDGRPQTADDGPQPVLLEASIFGSAGYLSLEASDIQGLSRLSFLAEPGPWNKEGNISGVIDGLDVTTIEPASIKIHMNDFQESFVSFYEENLALVISEGQKGWQPATPKLATKVSNELSAVSQYLIDRSGIDTCGPS